MANEIQVIENITYVGFNFITQKWYVRNLDSYITAENIDDEKAINNAKNILDVVAPNNTVSRADIKALKDNVEPIKNIYYSLEKTGKYIEKIQFNEYEDYAITYEEPNLYIGTLNELWDMSSSLSTTVVVDYMISAFYHKLHLEVPKETMEDIISYYHNIQKPYVYNVIIPSEEEGDTLKYSNILSVNNVDKTSKGEYTGTKNPESTFNIDILDIKSVSGKSIVTNKVTELDKGDSIYIINKDFAGTVDNVNGNIINLTSNVPSGSSGKLVCNAYKVNYAGYDNYEKFNPTYQIKDMSDHTIHFMQTTMDNSFESGDKIYINGKEYTVDEFHAATTTIENTPETQYETIGGETYEVSEYKDGTVNTIGDLIYVNSYMTTVEKLPTYTFTLKDETPLNIELKTSYKLTEKSITLNILPSVAVGDTIELVNYDTERKQYTIEKIEADKKKLFVKEEVSEYTFESGKAKLVQLRIPSKRILLNMTYSIRSDKMPTGEFMLDNDQQFTNYLNNYNIVIPTSTNYGNFNREVDKIVYVGNVKMQLK